jgi:tungstate transport system ATP-binding protein
MTAAPDHALVSIRDITVERPSHRVLDVPELDLLRGEILGIIGPNGAGKSTLALIIGLLRRPDSGQILFDGEEVDWGHEPLDLRRRAAMVLQEPLLFDTSVFENVASGLRIRGASRAQILTRVSAWLRKLEVEHLASRSARALSGGEAQRVSLARALVLEPSLLILDEPFQALDPPTREELLSDLLPLLRGTMTTLLISHDLSEAFDICDRIGVLDGGQLAQLDRPAAVLAHPATPAVARLIRSERRRAGLESGIKVMRP